MADIVLTRDETGKLAGLTQADQRRWAKFTAAVKRLGVGDTLKATFRLPRSPKFHRRHFALLKALFDCQEQFTDFDRFRDLQKLTQLLENRGYTPADIAAIMHGNWIRFFSEVLPD